MGRLMNRLNGRMIAIAVAVLVVAGGAGLALWSNSNASHAAVAYRDQRQALDANLAAARQQGFTSADLAPITSQARTVDESREPLWLLGRPAYYDGMAGKVASLRRQLTALERRIVDDTRSDLSRQTDAAKASLAQARQVNAADVDVQSLQQRLDTVARAEGAAHTVKDFRAADQQAQSAAHDAGALFTAAQAEYQAVQQAAAQLVAQQGGNLGPIQQAGQQAVADANNDGTVLAYLAKEMPIKRSSEVARNTSLIGKYAPMIGSGDVNQAAMGTAGLQRYGQALRGALIASLPAKAVIISFQDQHLWSWENGQMIKETPVTTGIWGVGDIGTDFGPMKVLRKAHPWTMQSPWPKTSPYYYPDTVVQWTTFFTNSGESIHDASWEPDSLLGPGSQYNQSTRSHGCVHVPYGLAQWMFEWADLGMPVIVYPGDGSSVANQVAKITTDDSGNPRSYPH
jgi:L,D-transpeptidase catalytic domain